MNSDYFSLLIQIMEKRGCDDFPQSEAELLADRTMLKKCIDNVLIDEFCLYGLQTDDSPNCYGEAIEDAIDYFNHYRFNLEHLSE